MSNPLTERLKHLARNAVDKLPVQPKVASEWQRLALDVDALRAELRDLQASHGQLEDVIREMGGLLPPPKHLQLRIVGGYYAGFLESGRSVVSDLDKVLARVHTNLKSFGRILDFGAGCGRVLRALRAHVCPMQKLYGTDIDAEAIEWCQSNYASIAEFSVNPSEPPMCYADNSFDFILSISIFTHLPEEMQFAWLGELYRVARPGAYLVLTVHGENYYHNIPVDERFVMSGKGFYYLTYRDTEGLPSFYQTAFHSSAYIRERWAKHFEIIDIQEGAVGGYQDAVLCRKRA